MTFSVDNELLLNLSKRAYLQHESQGIIMLDNNQIAQLNSLLQTDTGNFNLSFPGTNTLVIYNDYFFIEYAHLPEPIVKAFENPEKARERIIKDAREKEMTRQRERFKAIREKRALEAKREEMQSRVLDKMGVRLKVDNKSERDESHKTFISPPKERTYFKAHDVFSRYNGVIKLLSGIIFCLMWSYLSEGQNPIDHYSKELGHLKEGLFSLFLFIILNLIWLALLLGWAIAIAGLPFIVSERMVKFWNEDISEYSFGKKLLITIGIIIFILFWLLVIGYGVSTMDFSQ